MARLSPYLRSIRAHDGRQRLGFWCPGCDGMHQVIVRSGDHHPSWDWNGLVLKPTFTPSILVTCRDPNGEVPNEVCHSYVTDGRIQFLSDCTHALAGQTVDLPVWDKPYGGTED